MFDFLFQQYSQYNELDIFFEIVAVTFGLLSVWFSKNNNILVYPTGMISTSIFTYLLFKWGLLGDMMINAYYFIMSIYGWYIWTLKKNNIVTPISKISNYEKKISLAVSSAASLDNLSSSNGLLKQFKRTSSRLHELTS